jgi:hypothetical protein
MSCGYMNWTEDPKAVGASSSDRGTTRKCEVRVLVLKEGGDEERRSEFTSAQNGSTERKEVQVSVDD